MICICIFKSRGKTEFNQLLFFFIQPVMQALQQRYAVTAGQPYVVPQRTQPVYVMAIQTDTGCSVPLVMDGVVSRNKFCNSLFSMLFYCGYGYAVSKMEFHITHSNFLGYSSYDTIFLFHVKQIEEKIYQHLYVFRCESKDNYTKQQKWKNHLLEWNFSRIFVLNDKIPHQNYSLIFSFFFCFEVWQP